MADGSPELPDLLGLPTLGRDRGLNRKRVPRSRSIRGRRLLGRHQAADQNADRSAKTGAENLTLPYLVDICLAYSQGAKCLQYHLAARATNQGGTAPSVNDVV